MPNQARAQGQQQQGSWNSLRVPPGPAQGAYIVKYLARHVDGIGEATAHKLWQAHGPALYRILAGDEVAALEPIVGPSRAAEILDVWKSNLAERDVAVWLDENRFDTGLANKVVRIWGRSGVAKLRQNPYVMLTFAPWNAVDDAAYRIGIEPEDHRRLVGAVEAALYARLAEGHTAAPRQRLVREVQHLLRSSITLAEQAITAAERDGGAMPLRDGRLQAAGAAVMERYVESRVAGLRTASRQMGLFEGAPQASQIGAAIDRFEQELGYRLTDEQHAAVNLAVSSRIGLILGGAGVGKTTTLRAVHAACEAHGRQVIQMTLAGRAARRLQEATGRSAYTIAGFLLKVSKADMEISPGALLIVDEASMLDLPVTYRILRAVPESARLLLVGDPAQLQPIGFGLVLQVAATSSLPAITLTRVHRQAERTGIPRVAASLRDGVLPSLPLYAEGNMQGVSLLPCDRDNLSAALTDLMADLGGQNECQILTPLRHGQTGVAGINTHFHRLCSAGRPCMPGRDLSLDEPVIWTKNDWSRGLMNGSLGTIVALAPDRIVVSFDGVEHSFDEQADVQKISLAYAITVHKSQGSQFRRVIIPIFPGRILDRTLIYTAVTRATDQVVLVGDMAALRKAIIALPRHQSRDVGLSL